MTSSNLTRSEARARSAAITLDSYDVTIDVTAAADPQIEHFGTTSTLTFDSSVAETFLDFVDGEVDEVTVNGRQIEHHYDGARVHLSTLSVEQTNTVTVRGRGRYSTSGQGLHRFTDPADGNTYLYTQYEPSDSRRVYAQFDQPDLKAHHTFHVAAPQGWLAWSNQPEIADETFTGTGAEAGVVHHFAPTPPLSTYITAVMAGPYHQVRDTYTSADGSLTVELGLACRPDRAAHLDADALFDLTKRGLDFFNEAFGFPYPWGKYDQIFVPEYNLGAMENPGCVTFTEQYLFREQATRSQYAGRCNTLMHEMSHMWFGDLVTPRWWDDLWLKESFAEFMGAHASIETGAFAEAWVGFAGRRKAWAYAQDTMPTTHPIVADIPDVEAAKQNFDGITYAKGASVLKQLVHYVGLDAFFAGARSYFARHAWGSTTLDDLLVELEAASGRLLGAWSKAWLETAGPDVLTTELTISDEGLVESLRVHQESHDALTGAEVYRPHVIGVGLYDLTSDTGSGDRTAENQGSGKLTRRELVSVELGGEGAGSCADVTSESLIGREAPALVLVNDGDWSYALVRLDDRSLRTALDHVGSLDDPLARALIWSQLWSMTRDGLVKVRDYTSAVLRHAAGEADAATLGSLFTQAQTAIDAFEAPSRVVESRRLWLKGLSGLLAAPGLGADQRLLVARAFAAAAARVPESAPAVRNLLTDPGRVAPDLTVGQDLRWQLLTALSATGEVAQGQLADELARDNSMDGHTHHHEAVAAGGNSTGELVELVLRPRSLSNDHLDAVLAGLRTPLRDTSTDQAIGDGLARLRQVWGEHSIEIAQRLVRGLFPSADPAAAAWNARVWLDANTDAPSALRRLVLELTDVAERKVRVQAANA